MVSEHSKPTQHLDHHGWIKQSKGVDLEWSAMTNLLHPQIAIPPLCSYPSLTSHSDLSHSPFKLLNRQNSKLTSEQTPKRKQHDANMNTRKPPTLVM